MKKSLPLSDIPNQDGFKFWGIPAMISNVRIPCIVKKNADGLHQSINEWTGQPNFKTLQCWERK